MKRKSTTIQKWKMLVKICESDPRIIDEKPPIDDVVVWSLGRIWHFSRP
jgi:hypothetical protein